MAGCFAAVDFGAFSSGGPDASADSGGVEAGDDADAGDAASFCDPGDLCDDFDGTKTLDWHPSTKNGGTAVVDTVHAFSRSHALHLHKPAGAMTEEEAKLIAAFPRPMKSCDAMVWIEQTSGSGALEIFKYVDSTDDYALFLRRSTSASTFILQVGTFEQPVPISAITVGGWHRITQTLDGSSYHVAIDGVDTPITLQRLPPASAMWSILVGVNFESPNDTSWDVFVDDIRCKLAP
jgi:hypothetical protein